jgi:hypothetical protein
LNPDGSTTTTYTYEDGTTSTTTSLPDPTKATDDTGRTSNKKSHGHKADQSDNKADQNGNAVTSTQSVDQLV